MGLRVQGPAAPEPGAPSAVAWSWVSEGGRTLYCRGQVLTVWLGTAALMTSCYLDAFFWSCAPHSTRSPCAQADLTLRGLCRGLGRGSLGQITPHT